MPWSLEVWQIAGLCFLAVCIATAFVTDLRNRRIPNQLILLALALGLVLNALGPSGTSDGIFSLTPGALGLLGSLWGALAGLFVFLPLYALRAMGAGDVKLFAAVGSFAGTSATLNIALLVLLAGGVLAIVRMVMMRNSHLVLQNTLLILGQMLPGSVGTFDPKIQTVWRMPYAVAIAAGVMAYGFWILSGRSPFLNF